jgi:hypothetical protein
MLHEAIEYIKHHKWGTRICTECIRCSAGRIRHGRLRQKRSSWSAIYLAETVLMVSHLSGSWRHSRPPALLLRPETSPSCSNCRHGHCRHHVNVDCCNPRRGRLLFSEMPIGSIFSQRPSVLSLASEMRVGLCS